MLKTRVLTALGLVSLLLPALFLLSQTAWAVLVAGVAGLAAWEWAAFLAWQGAQRVLFGSGMAVICLMLTVFADGLIELQSPLGVMPVYVLATLFWGLAVPFSLATKWRPGALFGGVLGAIVILPTWFALVHLRLLGPIALLAIMAVVWLADIAAYFFGKNFGRHKLAPGISPGKTWEGVAGACLAVLAYGFIMRALFDLEHVPALLWAVGLVAVTAVSVVGDLYESLQKRQCGLKDSSHLLPGHGGVLDRIDSLTSTLPVVAFFWLLLAVKTP